MSVPKFPPPKTPAKTSVFQCPEEAMLQGMKAPSELVASRSTTSVTVEEQQSKHIEVSRDNSRDWLYSCPECNVLTGNYLIIGEKKAVDRERPWLASYPEGMRWNLEAEKRPIYEMLEVAAKNWPDQSAIAFLGKKISYRELESLVTRAAKGFQKLGVKPGVHVGLFLANTPHYIVSFMGVLRAGGTVVNYSPLDAERTLEHKIEDSETDLMVTLDLDAFYPQIANFLGRTRLQKLVVGSMLEFGGSLSDAAAQQPSKPIKFNPQCLSFASLLDNDGQFTSYPIEADGSSLAVLQYTGGTTGAPKGAMLTHTNISSGCTQLLEMLGSTLDLGSERILGASISYLRLDGQYAVQYQDWS